MEQIHHLPGVVYVELLILAKPGYSGYVGRMSGHVVLVCRAVDGNNVRNGRIGAPSQCTHQKPRCRPQSVLGIVEAQEITLIQTLRPLAKPSLVVVAHVTWVVVRPGICAPFLRRCSSSSRYSSWPLSGWGSRSCRCSSGSRCWTSRSRRRYGRLCTRHPVRLSSPKPGITDAGVRRPQLRQRDTSVRMSTIPRLYDMRQRLPIA